MLRYYLTVSLRFETGDKRREESGNLTANETDLLGS